MPDKTASSSTMHHLSPLEQARVLRMASREIESTLTPELASVYAQHVAKSLMAVLNNVALAAEGLRFEGAVEHSAAGQLQRARAADAAISQSCTSEVARLAELDVAVTAERVDAYLRTNPELKNETTARISQLPGGFSKQTFMLDAASGRKLVIRRDLPRGPTPASAADEFPILNALAAAGLPVPRALGAEKDPRFLGYPFIIVERVEGQSATQVAGQSPELGRRVCIQLAQVLGRLHSLDPSAVGLAPSRNPVACVSDYVRSWHELWHRRSTDHSEMVEAGFAWLQAHIPQNVQRLALIHGDARPDNMLATADGRVTALLDWEFIHVGDPVEDLLYACQFIGSFIDTQAFLDAYRDAGGVTHDDSRSQFYEIWRNVRNLVCLDLSWSAFATGDYPAYVAGTPSLLFRRALIVDLARCLQATGL